MAALEDKIVQQAVVTIVNAIYEEDFLGFTHISGKNRNGTFVVRRRTIAQRLQGKAARD